MKVSLADYIELPSMQEVFFELLPGIILRPAGKTWEMKIPNPLTGVFHEEPPMVMIDGVFINDLNVVAGLNPEKVESIEVVKTPYLFGDLILHGIVNIITRKGNFAELEIPSYATILNYSVTVKVPQFSAPEYYEDSVKYGHNPDFRNTLLWDPSVKTGNEGETSLEFWSSDLPGTYLITITGITPSGEIISCDKSFRIR